MKMKMKMNAFIWNFSCSILSNLFEDCVYRLLVYFFQMKLPDISQIHFNDSTELFNWNVNGHIVCGWLCKSYWVFI